jgi:methylated-DNA-[protein]-cysteine S-methyltransferase
VTPTPVGGLWTVSYDAPGWGVGELVFRDDVPVHHEEPRARRGHVAAPRTPPQIALVERLRAYFARERVTFADLDLAPALAWAGATAFEADCVRALQAVPYGEVISYRDLAVLAGRPGANRAAGTVCARGTLSVLVPYHRVIRSDGTIGSFGPGGDGLKRRLLALEGVRL